jgi:hypothetical protein
MSFSRQRLKSEGARWQAHLIAGSLLRGGRANLFSVWYPFLFYFDARAVAKAFILELPDGWNIDARIVLSRSRSLRFAMTEYRTESVFFAVALILAIAAASVTTVNNTPGKNSEPVAHAEPHEQPDLSPGEPLRNR